MSDLVEFLRARLDEDEAIARAAVTASDRLWALDDDGLGNPWVYDSDNGSPLIEAIMGEGDREVLTHVVAHHPDRVLREVEAKRVALNWYENDDDVVMAATIYAMAAIYSDHPDYRDEWKP